MSGRQVRDARQAREWTQTDLAEKLGVSQAYVSLLESNRRPVSAAARFKTVSVLGLLPTALPVLAKGDALSSGLAASALGRLGYWGSLTLRRDAP